MTKFRKIYSWVPVMMAVAFVLGLVTASLIMRHSGPTPGQKKLQTILNLIEHQYVDVVDLDSLIERTLPSLLTSLDPHSAYIPASDLQMVNDELGGSFSGIGIQFMINNDTVMVLDAISGGPSEKVGIKAGDRIVTVDGETIAGVGITNEKVMSILRGDKGSTVKLGIHRHNTPKTLKFDVVRGDIPVTSIDAAYIASPGIGYIKVNKFGRTTYDEFWQKLNDLNRQGAQDFIIDLRGNTGGFMEVAFLMANEFLEGGETIVSTRGRKENSFTGICADGRGSFKESQLVVLIDEMSASSSEIFAGALQDNDRALIIGRRSFGKGLIQEQTVLPDSSALRLTVGRYYTPSGRSIQKDYSNIAIYEHDLLDRYNRGEMFSRDSIKLDKNLQFTTRSGRLVYGGGGIMPDIFVPNDTTGVTSYYIAVANAGLLQKFAFDFVDANRQTLSQATDTDQLLSLLPTDDILLSQFVGFGVRNGVPARWYYINISRELIVNQLKALIARDVLGYDAYFRIINASDPNMLRAIDEMLQGSAAFPLLPAVTSD